MKSKEKSALANSRDPKTGQWGEGNQLWEFYGKNGKRKNWTQDQLLKEYFGYAQWCIEHPLIEDKIYNTKEGITHEDVAKKRIQTIIGYCMFADIPYSTFYEYKTYAGYSDVYKLITQSIENDSIEGAAGQILDSNIVKAHLGLADISKKTIELTTDAKTSAMLDTISKSLLLKEKNENIIDISHEEVG